MVAYLTGQPALMLQYGAVAGSPVAAAANI